MTTSTLNLFCGFAVTSLVLMTSGCIWRSADTDHIWGPTLVRVGQPPLSKAYFWEERFVIPLAFEGGEHIGLTIGFLKRFAANPVEFDKQMSLQWCNGLFNTPCTTLVASDGWQWSFLHSRIVHHHSPEFYDRSLLGASGGAGDDGYGLTLGYSTGTRHKPRDNSYHILCYGRDNPMRTRFWVTKDTTDFIYSLTWEAC